MLIKNSIILVIVIFSVNLVFAQTSRWRVVWNPNPATDSVSYYEVYIGSDSNSVNLIGTVNHPTTEYADSLGIGGLGLNPGQIYYYRIKAVNQHGAGPFSNAAYASIPEITFTQLSLPVSTDTTFSLNQSQFVNDPDYGISQLEWDVIDLVPGDLIQDTLINSHTINFVTPADSTVQDLLLFKVFDVDSFYSLDTIRVSLTRPTFPPVVSGIPDQAINLGQLFTSFDLDDYVTDADHSDSELTWTTSGENNLTVNINVSTHVVNITATDTNWVGNETITFRATDPDGLFDEVNATFRINAIPVAPVVSGIPDQTIVLGQSFVTFDLDNYVTDQDNSPDQLTWTTSGENNLNVSINDTSHIVTIVPNNSNWVGNETITFRATDPGSLYGEDAAVFTILAPPVVAGIPDQTIQKDSLFSTFDLDNYVIDSDNTPDQLTWTVSGAINLNININASSHVVTITAIDTNWVGSETITFRATDPDGLFDEDVAVFAINAPGNNAPVFTSEPIVSATAGRPYLYLATADDQDGDSLIFSFINGHPVFLFIVRNDSTTATSAYISGTPTISEIGSYIVKILVSDNKGGTDEQEYELTVTAGPVIEQSDEILVYPVPYVVSKSPVNSITFKNMPSNSQLVLYNLLGEPVFATKVENELYLWNIKNNSGLDVQSGLYFYYVKDGSKILSSGKIVIIR